MSGSTFRSGSIAESPFDGGNLLHPALVAPAGLERGGQPRLQDAFRLGRAELLRAQDEDVGVVVRAAALGVEGVVAHPGADARHLVRGDGDPDAGLAQEDPPVELPARPPPRPPLSPPPATPP